jgi:hypothetical protein
VQIHALQSAVFPGRARHLGVFPYSVGTTDALADR